MSQENVDTLRRLFDLVGQGENPEALYELLDPDIEMTIAPDDLEGGRYVGHAGVREFFRRWAGTWETWRLYPERIIDAGEDQVVVDLRERGRGKGSGVEVEKRTGQAWTFRNGLVVRWENFATLAEALEAVGLSEQAMSQAKNVEIVRAVHEAFLRGDQEAIFKPIAHDLIWDDSRFVGGETFHGHDGMNEGTRRWFGAWEEYEVEFYDYRDIGDYVVAFYRQRGRGKGSGVEVEMTAAQVWTLSAGIVQRVDMYPDQSEALEAVGLSE